MNRRLLNSIIAITAMMALIVFITSAGAQREQAPKAIVDGRDVTILVTVHAHSERTRSLAESLKPEDFSVREDDRSQRIISVKRATEAPLILSVLIQDDLVSGVNNEIRGIKSFIRRLPAGSRVMTGYITVGTLRVAQDFTADLERAADSLRIVIGSRSASPFNPYVEVVEALRRFDSQPAGRRMILLISDGLDTSRGFRSASPMLSVDLDRAIDEAQRRGVAVFAFYAPSVGLTSISHLAVNYGQGSLNRIADETGGEAFFTGSGLVSFDPYFKELTETFGHQWLITYRSTSVETGFRKIEVNTEYDLELLHAPGYRLRSSDIPRP
jgi:VWFA-related protein